MSDKRGESMRQKMLRRALNDYDALIKGYRGLLAAYRTGNHSNVDSILTKIEVLDNAEIRARIEALFARETP